MTRIFLCGKMGITKLGLERTLMKKHLIGILFLMLVLTLCLVSCVFGHTHTYGEWYIGEYPTCTSSGEQYRVCDCGDTEHEPLPPLPHEAGAWEVRKEATCTETGEQVKPCIHCGATVETATLPTNDTHTETVYTTLPTCTEQGLTLVVCTACDKELSEIPIPATGHTESQWIIDIEPTCTETGTYHIDCTVCGEQLSTGVAPLADHTESEWVVAKEASKTTEGSRYKTCTVCKETVRTQVIHKGSQGLAYEINPDGVTCTIVGIGDCTDLELVVPAIIDDCLVTAIGPNAFSGTSITKVVLPIGVTSIGHHAFFRCESLSSINIPDGVTVLEHHIFTYCIRLNSIVLPEGLTTIGEAAFSSSGIVSIVIPNSVTRIDSLAFYECRYFHEITMGTGIESIGTKAFVNSSSLDRVNIFDIAAWCNIEFADYDYSNPLYFARNLYLNGSLVTHLAIPEGVTAIPKGAFIHCDQIVSVSIPKSVTQIGSYAFEDCRKLSEIRYDGTVAEWGSIDLVRSWNYMTPAYTIYCTDGELTKE